MDLRRKMSFLAGILYSDETGETSVDRLKEGMRNFFLDGYYEENAGLLKFIDNVWGGAKNKSFQKRTKDKVVSFFYQEEIRKELWGEITEDEIYKILFVYSLEHLENTFKRKQSIKSYDYEMIRSYNEYVDYRENELEDLFEYKNTYFYLYRLHSYKPSTMREVLVFNKESNNSLSCTYYRYIPRSIHGQDNDKSRYVFVHKGNVLIASKGRVFCFFPPSRTSEPKQQDSGFVTLALILGGNVKGGLFTKLSDASFDPASGRLALEEIADINKEVDADHKEDDIKKLVISFGFGENTHKKYKEALNNKNHTTGKADNLLLFNPQYQSEIVGKEIVLDEAPSPTKKKKTEKKKKKVKNNKKPL